MKISGNDFLNFQPSVKNQKKVSNQSFENVLRAKNKDCDEIIISSKINQTESESFVESLSKKICDEVKTPVTKEKLEELKKQVNEGTYKIDIDEIVKKFMLD